MTETGTGRDGGVVLYFIHSSLLKIMNVGTGKSQGLNLGCTDYNRDQSSSVASLQYMLVES